MPKRRRSRPALVCAAFCATVCATTATACPYRIDDGDTLAVVATGEVVRMRGYDTPEIGTHAWCEAELRLGMAAKARAEQLVCGDGTAVEIDRGAVPAHDRYRRTLAIVRVGGEDLAGIMVREGWARPYNGGRRKGSSTNATLHVSPLGLCSTASPARMVASPTQLP